MRKYFDVLKKSPLFSNLSELEISKLLECMNAAIAEYPRGGMIFLAGNIASRVGIVCEGGVQVIREDFFGNRAILTKLAEGGIFGETFACARIDILPVSVEASEECAVLMLDYRKIITTCSSACDFHNKLIENMLRIIAEKNLTLNQKIEALSARSTRDKLLIYLSSQAAKADSKSFTIPFSRQELADYLSVDRSAMSAELGRMRDDGVLRFYKNSFELFSLEPKGSDAL